MKLVAIIIAWISNFFNPNIIDPQAGYVIPTIVSKEEIVVVNTVVPTKKVVSAVPKPSAYATATSDKWGVATQVDEHTWTMKIQMDKRMATPKEILEALNDYRNRKGSQKLVWDEKLAEYATNRAKFLTSIKNVDGHKGFQNYLDNENGFEKLGFTWLGENISYGYKLEGVHLIEWMYAGDKPHDDNQLNNRWNYVGIGVDGTATALIFGTGRR